MPINGDKYDFTQKNVDCSPNQAGVYALYRGDELTYYGRARGGEVTIRTRLKAHKAGYEGPCTQNSNYYKREITNNAVTREKQLIDEYIRIHGRLPRCNDVKP